MLPAPSDEGVEIYGLEYAQALSKAKLGEANLVFMPVERIEALIGELYGQGYLIAQAHDQPSIEALAGAFRENRTIVIERPELFGTLRFLRPSDTLALIMEQASKAGLPAAFLANQFEKLVQSLYVSGVVVAQCDQEKERHWFVKYHSDKGSNPVIRLRPAANKEREST